MAVLVSGAAGPAGPVLPGLGQQEARVGVDVGAMPWAAVVRLQVPGVSRCTGFLVGPQTVVTAAHCVYGRRTGRFVPPGSVHVLLGYVDGGFLRHAVASSLQVAAGYLPVGARGAQGSDVAVVTLAAPVVPQDGTLVIGEGPIAPGTPVMMGGYGQDRAERILADVSCVALGYATAPDGRAMLVHDCAGTRGTSGGPVLARAADGTWHVAGVQVAGNPDDVGGLAVPVAALRAMLPAH